MKIEQLLREAAAQEKSLAHFVVTSATRLEKLVHLRAPACTIEREIEILGDRILKLAATRSLRVSR